MDENTRNRPANAAPGTYGRKLQLFDKGPINVYHLLTRLMNREKCTRKRVRLRLEVALSVKVAAPRFLACNTQVTRRRFCFPNLLLFMETLLPPLRSYYSCVPAMFDRISKLAVDVRGFAGPLLLLNHANHCLYD